MDNKGEEDSQYSFHFDKRKAKTGKNMNSITEKRMKNFMKDKDATDVKRTREDHHANLRKDAKKNLFNKRRRLNKQKDTDKEEKKEEQTKKFTVEEADSMYTDGMDLMDYFHILNKTEFALPHFLNLIEYI
jgi:hypothetical protein